MPESTNDKNFEGLGSEVGRLVDRKNAAYGSSFDKSGTIMRVLYPDGIAPDQYEDMLALVRVIDKLFRIANHKDAFGESPYQDLAGYGLLGLKRQLANRREAEGNLADLDGKLDE